VAKLEAAAVALLGEELLAPNQPCGIWQSHQGSICFPGIFLVVSI